MIKKEEVKAFLVEITLTRPNNKSDIHRVLAYNLPQALQIALDEYNRKYVPEWEINGFKEIIIRGID